MLRRAQTALILLLYASKVSGCYQRNVACSNIRSAGGFTFTFHHPPADISMISVYDNKGTVIARAVPSKQIVKFSSQVLSMNTDSLVTRDCSDIRVEYLLLDGRFVADSCEAFTVEVMVEEKPSGLGSHSRNHISTVAAFALLCVGVITLLLHYMFRKKCGNSTADQTQTSLLDHNRGHVGIQPLQNRDASVPHINGAANDGATDRNMTNDPGGMNNTSGQLTVWSSERQDHVNLTMPMDGAAVQDFDVTGKAESLVFKCGLHLDQVSGCSISPETDVKSQHEGP